MKKNAYKAAAMNIFASVILVLGCKDTNSNNSAIPEETDTSGCGQEDSLCQENQVFHCEEGEWTLFDDCEKQNLLCATVQGVHRCIAASDGDIDSESDIYTDSDIDADSDMDTDSDIDTDSDVDTDMDSDTDTDSDSDVDSDSDIDADTDVDADLDADSDGDTDIDIDTDGDADTDTDVDSSGDTNVDTDTNNDEDSEIAGENCGDGICSVLDDETCLTCVLDCDVCPDTIPDGIGVAGSTAKFRPDTPVPEQKFAEIEAARNEFEPFQVVINGGSEGAMLMDAALSSPTDGVYSIPIDKTFIYREGLYYVTGASSLEGGIGDWPDPLIPQIDSFYHEKRNAFPMEIPANETRALWVDFYVPQDAITGNYQGSLTLTFTGGSVEIPFAVKVRDFTLPSTSSLATTFGLRWDPCAVHLGSYEACGDAGIEKYLLMYGNMGLDHRMTMTPVYYYPTNGDWSHFDELYGPLLDGTNQNTLLPGAQLTTLPFSGNDVSENTIRLWREHFEEKGWTQKTKLFNYTCDEPPAGCAWSDIPTRAAPFQAAQVPSLVTVDYNQAVENNILDSIDLFVPLMNWTHPDSWVEGYAVRSTYDSWLEKPGKDLWWYISCVSHGCGTGCTGSTEEYHTNWPSYVIDATAMQARAMEWYTFMNDIHGELFYAVAAKLETAWDDQCDFGSSGDGNLLYPGTPDKIGGTNDIPIASIRLKLIREGMEDYEYLHMLETLGERDFAVSEAEALFAWHAVNSTTVEALADTRRRLADKIEELN